MTIIARYSIVLVIVLFLFTISANAAKINSINVSVTTEKEYDSILNNEYISIVDLINYDIGSDLNESIIKKHIRLFSNLGWIKEVIVKIESYDNDNYDIYYTLVLRAEITEIRFVGNTFLSDSELRTTVVSKIGNPFNLNQAIEDAMGIVWVYYYKGHPFSGVLESKNIVFKDGVLTFYIDETNLDLENICVNLTLSQTKERGM